MEQHIETAIEVLKKGGIVIYPTDTAFGIGCRVDDRSAIKRLFSLRRRPETQATPVLMGNIGMVKEYVTEVPKEVEEELIKRYWPGALTIILNSKKDNVSDLVRGGTETIGVRIPNHEITLALINGLRLPLLGPSANFHGEPTPYTFEDLDPELLKLVDYVVPGECTVKEASTVIDCTVTPWSIRRQGAVEVQSSKLKV